MNKINELSYYPRFVFNTSENNSFSTIDLELFKHFKEADRNNKINHFKKNQIIDITTSNKSGETVVKTYKVTDIEIQQIKYDFDEISYGVNMNDDGRNYDEKKWLVEIYIFLDLIK